PAHGAAPSVPATASGPSQRCSGSGSCRGSGGKETAGSRSRSALSPGPTRAGHGTTHPREPPAAPEARSQPRAPAQPSAAPTCAGAASELRRRLTGLRPLPPLPGPHTSSANAAANGATAALSPPTGPASAPLSPISAPQPRLTAPAPNRSQARALQAAQPRPALSAPPGLAEGRAGAEEQPWNGPGPEA
ncbi:atherin-like, partial [Pyrgilauda ruficollis]|uniref:atherin-like n=1 Tax=Pyrgilauda ruficollis TaxID=221976 RepID=UPI001B873C86